MNEFKHILDIHPSPVVVHMNFKPLYANDAFAAFSGLESAEDILSLDSLLTLINPDEHQDSKERYQLAFDNAQTPAKVVPHIDLKGNPVIAEITDKPIIWQGQEALCTFINIVTDRVKREERVKRLLEIDELTQIHNRRYIRKVLDNIIESNTAEEYYLCVLDIDFFKKVNDTYGHPVGDMVLIELAQRLQSFCQAKDHLARIGGEEFVLLLHTQDIDVLKKYLERLRQYIAQYPFHIQLKDQSEETHAPREDLILHISISIGVTKLAQEDEILEAYQRADKALYQVKKQGRNNIVYA